MVLKTTGNPKIILIKVIIIIVRILITESMITSIREVIMKTIKVIKITYKAKSMKKKATLT